MRKVVINVCYGGFGLSDEAELLYLELTGNEDGKVYDYELKRDDPQLVEVVEQLGKHSWGEYAKLRVVEIPDDNVAWLIHNYDGMEHVAEDHRTWS